MSVLRHYFNLLCLILLFTLVAAVSSAATDTSPANASFRFSLFDQQNILVSKCVATRVAPRWVITAAHCLPEEVTHLVAHCPTLSGVTDSRLSVGRVVVHPEMDLAMLRLPDLLTCVQQQATLAEPLAEDTELFSVLLNSKKIDKVKFETLQQDELTLALYDADACLARGDSGYPLYAQQSGEPVLAAMLMGGTEECPNYQQAVRLDKQRDWIKDSIKERVSGSPSKPGCDGGPCLQVDHPQFQFCSVDPPALGGLVALDKKSKISIQAGSYDLSLAAINALPPLDLETAVSSERYVPRHFDPVKRIQPLEGSEDKQHRLEITSIYESASGKKIRLSFRVSPMANSTIYRLGEEHAASFLSKGLTMRVNYSDDAAVLYVPCGLDAQTEKTFVFAFANGIQVNAYAYAVTGSFELGYSFGRLLRASITKQGATEWITDWYSLGYLGSSLNEGDLNAPALVVRTGPFGDTCGYVFDSGDWDSGQAVNGYLAYSLRCDNSLGNPIPLASVVYPGEYVFP